MIRESLSPCVVLALFEMSLFHFTSDVSWLYTYIVYTQHIQIDEGKINAIRKWPTPTAIQQIPWRGFFLQKICEEFQFTYETYDGSAQGKEV